MKYKLDTSDSIIENGKTLYRVIYLQDLIIEDNLLPIAKDSKGGYIETMENLSQEGKCFLLGRSIIMGDSKVSGNTQIHGDVKIYGHTIIKGNSNISNNAHIYESDIDGDYNITNSVKLDHAWLKGRGTLAGRFTLEDMNATDLTLLPVKPNTEHISIVEKKIPIFNFDDLFLNKGDCFVNIVYPGFILFKDNIEEIVNILEDDDTLNDFFQIEEHEAGLTKLIRDRVKKISDYDDKLWDYNYV